MTFGNYPFFKSALYSVVITVLSTFLILLFTSMAAWYIARRNSTTCKAIYYLCVFSMVVPFQMVMFTLSKTADKLNLNSPWTIPIVYLGFGAGLAIFMFTGFVKSIPVEIEEAAIIDGCGPVRTFFLVVMPMLYPTMISVGILELMWVWNDYLLPVLVLDINEYRTIPIHIQYLKGSYGTVDLGATMALILLSIIPVVVFYLACQKHIIKGLLQVQSRDNYIKRSSGILMPLFSLPSPYGIGTLGKVPTEFVDFKNYTANLLANAPVCPTSFGIRLIKAFRLCGQSLFHRP